MTVTPIIEAVAKHLKCSVNDPKVIAFIAIAVDQRISNQSKR